MNLEDDILIEQFLRNELSEQEKESFLERVKNDTNFREEYLLEKQLFESLNEEEWSFAENIDNKETDELEALFESKEIQNLKEVIKKASTKPKVSRGKVISFLSGFAAAVVLGFLILKPMFSPSVLDTNVLYAEYVDFNNLPSFTERGVDDSKGTLIEAEKLFKQKKYDESVVIFQEFLNENRSESGAYIYAALAQAELKNFDKAIEILDTLKESDLVDAEKAYWYKSLVYLKEKQTEKAITELQHIIDNSFFNKEKAEELLIKLK